MFDQACATCVDLSASVPNGFCFQLGLAFYVFFGVFVRPPATLSFWRSAQTRQRCSSSFIHSAWRSVEESTDPLNQDILADSCTRKHDHFAPHARIVC